MSAGFLPLLLLLLASASLASGAQASAGSTARASMTLEVLGQPEPPPPLPSPEGGGLGGGQPEHPAELVARCRFRLRLTVQTDDPFPGPGESVRVELPHYHAVRLASTPQTRFATRPGFTRIVRGPPGAVLRTLDPELALLADDTPSAFEVWTPRAMAPGEVLEVLYGVGGDGAAEAQELAVEPTQPGYKPFRCWHLNPNGEPVRELARLSPAVRPGPAVRLEVVAPGTARPRRPYEVRVIARDAHGNVATGFEGSVGFSSSGRVRLPGPVSMRRSDAGTILAGGFEAWTTGVLRIEARAVGRRGLSNPTVVSATGPAVVFGDLHVHCGEVSADAFGGCEEVYARARHVEGLDFVAKTDHDGETTPALWERTRDLARDHTSPGRFVALLGFEWTPGYSWGHRTVLFPGDEGQLASCRWPGTETPAGLWAAIASQGGLALPHMPCAEPVEHHHFDWSRHRDDVEPLVEVFSQWSPVKDRWMAQDTETNPAGVQKALTMGYRLGLIAGGDNHVGMAVRTGGLAGMRVTTLTRAGLFEAMKARHTFATTGQRMQLELRCGPAGMGETDVSSGPVRLRGEVHGTGRLERVEIVKGWRDAELPLPVAHSVPGRGAPEVELDWTDPDVFDATFYYLRAVQSDGHQAWSSPVWVRREGAPPSPRPAPRRAGKWETFPVPGPFVLRTLEQPAFRAPSLSETSGGVELQTPAPRWASACETLRTMYYRLETPRFSLAPERRYRLSFRLSGSRGATVSAVLLDENTWNVGLFVSAPVPAAGRPVDVSREFWPARAHGPVRLCIFFPLAENRYRLDRLTLEAAVR